MSPEKSGLFLWAFDMDPKNTNRVYSTMVVKAVDEDKREITGIASTPGTDRMGDIVVPSGAKFNLPVPLLFQHDHAQPIGQVVAAKVTDAGIEIVARLAKIEAPSQLAARLEEAWQSIKHGLVRGLSIGFRPIKYAFLDDGGIEFSEWDWYELSAVTIPANAEASITSVKSFDTALRASSGTKRDGVVRLDNSPAGVSAPKQRKSINPTPKEGKDMNLQEQIKGLQATRKAKEDERNAIQQKAIDEGRTKDASEREQFETLTGEIKSIDDELADLKQLEQEQIKNATPIEPEDGRSFAAASASRGGERQRSAAIVRSVKEDEPGIGFARFAMAMFAGKGNVTAAKGFAESVFANDMRLQNVMKAAVAAGTTTSPTWAGNLVDYQNLSSEFVEFLRPRTIVGQFGVGNIPTLRRVPFKVRIPGKTTAGRAQWVGEGYRKPATASGYEATTLEFSKIAAFSVITEELERFSEPSIQLLVRDDLAEAVIERADEDFVDPSKAAGTGAGLSPASITNGVTPIPSSGDPESDINALWATADASNLPVGSAVYITNTATVRSLAGRRNPLGNREYPDVTMTGGFIDGVPVIVSNYVPAGLFILAFASEIYLADDGMVNIDISREATVFLDDEAATATPTAAQLVSLWQTNQVGIRAERFIHWKKRRPQAVAYLSGVSWGPQVQS